MKKLEQHLTNQRKITILQKVKAFLLKVSYRRKLETHGPIRIMGSLPFLKIPGNSKIIIGSKVVLNSDYRNSNTALTNRCKLVCGLNGTILIGDNSMLNGVCVTAYEFVEIGKNCQIASNTLITDTDFHPIDPIQREREALGYKIDYRIVNKKKIKIGNNVWIGWGAIILKGVNIGENSIIAAGAVVVDDIPANSIAAGSPAIVVKSI